MEETKLTIRLPRNLLEKANRYATQNHTTLSALIEAYLQNLAYEGSLENGPIVHRLSGVLSQDVSIEDYYDHLEEKY